MIANELFLLMFCIAIVISAMVCAIVVFVKKVKDLRNFDKAMTGSNRKKDFEAYVEVRKICDKNK